MTVKYEGIEEDYRPTLSIHDYINIAKEGNEVSIEVDLEYVPAVEHFANYKNSQIFLMVNFAITTLGKTNHHERCLACYPADKEKDEKNLSAKIANERLNILYEELEQVSIKVEKKFFNKWFSKKY